MSEIDLRETFENGEESLRAALVAHQRGMVSTLRVKVAQDSTDGHTVILQPVTQMNVKDQDGNVTQLDMPQLQDAPIHFTGGGLMVATHAIKQGDEGTATFSMMPIDVWHQSGQDTSQQIDSRTHSLSDASYLPGGKSDPNMIPKVDPDSHQIRTIDKKSVSEQHPTNGTTVRHADPSTQPASENFDPFTQATKFHDHAINPTTGHKATSTDGGTVHSHSLDHDSGFKASADNDQHTLTVHPQNGTGVTSSVAHTIQAPNVSLDAQGNLSNQGTHSAAGAITSAVSMGAPTGNFAGGSIGGIGFGAGGIMSLVGGILGLAAGFAAQGSVSSQGDVTAAGDVEGATVTPTKYLYTAGYTVAQLLALTDMLPGARAHITDYVHTSPTFYQVVGSGAGLGSTTVPVFYPDTSTGWVVA